MISSLKEAGLSLLQPPARQPEVIHLQRRLDTYLGIAAGVAAPLVYAGAVIGGGWATPGYSHLASTISELTTPGQPFAGQLDDVFVAYNLLLACFAAGLPSSVVAARQNAIRAASILLLTLALAGVGMVTIFPVAAPGAPATPTAYMHVLLAAVASLASIASIAAVTFAFWGIPARRVFARISLACLVVIVASGLWAASAVAGGWPMAGLAERLTIGTFMVWLLVFALGLAADVGPKLDR